MQTNHNGIGINEKLTPNGSLAIYKVYPDGRRELHFRDDNLIVSAAKLYILSSLYQVGVSSDPITNLQVGTGGTVDPGGLFPYVENPAATGLATYLLTVPTTYSVNTGNFSVTFIATVDQGTGNGSLITEAGLFKASNLMFNVKNFPGIPKTSAFGVNFQWTIQMA